MNILAQPTVERRRALELRAWTALVGHALSSELACAMLLQDMLETGVAYQRQVGDALRLRIAGVSSGPVGFRTPASVMLGSWHQRALDRLAGRVA